MKSKNARPIISFDYAIKTTLRDKANAGVLEGFLSALFDQEVRVLELFESESNRPDDESKYNRVDLLAKIGEGEQVIIEVQCESEYAYLKRLVYGSSRVIVDNLKIGDSYNQVKKVYSVSLFYFDPGEGDDYIYHGKTEFIGLNTHNRLKPKKQLTGERAFRINTGNVFPEYYLIPLNAFSGEVKSALDQWVYSFRNNEVLDEFDAPSIELLKEKLDYLGMIPAERKEYEDYALRQASLRGAYHNAKEEGKIETARAMMSEGFPVEQIAHLTGLSVEEIEKLRRGVRREGETSAYPASSAIKK